MSVAVSEPRHRPASAASNANKNDLPPPANDNAAVASALMRDLEVSEMLARLEVLLGLELKYRGSAQPAHSDNLTITSGMRDGSAHVLRCLKVWYDLPAEVFFSAVSSIDRFLTKMKAQPKHLSCIAVSAFHLACRCSLASADRAAPEPSDLVTISQSRCTPSDLLRMQAILVAKLELPTPDEDDEVSDAAASNAQPVTSLTLIRLMYDICRTAAAKMGVPELLEEANLPGQVIHQLEILSCDSLTLQHRPCEVALALLATYFQQRSAEDADAAQVLMGLVSELQRVCGIANAAFVRCLGIVVGQLDRYNGEGTVAHRQRLVWKLSNRTLRHLRPTDKLRPTLPTIKEGNQAAAGKAPRLRSNSECSEESMASLSESDDSEREMMEQEE